MYLVNSTISVFFAPIKRNIKTDVLNHQDLFSSHFCDPMIMPVADSMPIEIPRVNLSSINGNMVLNISPTSASLNTQYSGVKVDEWENYEIELSKPIDSIFDFLKATDRKDLLYCGTTLTLIHELEDNDNVVEYLSERFNKFTTVQKLYDYSTRFAIVVDNDYFVNLSFANVRAINVDQMEASKHVSGTAPDNAKQAMQIVIDINDKHAFNNQEKYNTSAEKLNQEFKISNFFVKNIMNIIEKGSIGEIQYE